MMLGRFLVSKKLYASLYRPLAFNWTKKQTFITTPYLAEDKKGDDDSNTKGPAVEKIPEYMLTKSVSEDLQIKDAATLLASANAADSKKNNPPPTKSPQRSDFIKRATHSGKCRWGFIPEEFFTFFYPVTGVSGPYLFIFGLANYMLSKEIYILEHEYYSGLSIFAMVLFAAKVFGKSIGESLDKDVDAIEAEYNKQRNDEIKFHKDQIASLSDSQMRAKAQKLLMDAKKENVAIQLEAIYRERALMLYQKVKRRLDYHVMRHQTKTRIAQQWMLDWILNQVKKSITPEFEKKALMAAIEDLASAAERFQKR